MGFLDSGGGVGLDVLSDEDQRIVIEEENNTTPKKDNLRHIVNPPNNQHIWRPGMDAQDVVDIARVRGIEVRALCGVRFVPTRNPEDVKETCNPCLDEAARIMGE